MSDRLDETVLAGAAQSTSPAAAAPPHIVGSAAVPTAPTAAGEVYDFNPPSVYTYFVFRRIAFLVIIIAVSCVIAGLTIAGLQVAGSALLGAGAASAMTYAATAVLIVVSISGALWVQHRAHKQVELCIKNAKASAAKDVLSEVLPEIWRRTRTVGASVALHRLPKLLRQRGLTDVTIRFAHSKQCTPIAPIMQTFEPRPLNEAEADFAELAAIGGADTPQADAALRAARDNEHGAMRWLHRNVVLNGGWTLVLIFGVMLALATFEAWRLQRVTWKLMWWGALFLTTLIVPMRGLRAGREEWLLTPGGVILRRARFRDAGWRLHVFDRHDSVLCVRRLRSGQWWAAVADETAESTTVLTAGEVQLLLRAWLSPLTPPAVERLSDLQ